LLALFEEIEAARDCSLAETKTNYLSSQRAKGQRVGVHLAYMTPKILMWNIRGLNAIEKRLKIRGLLRDWKADIVCLVETKMTVISREVVRSLWGCYHVDWCYLGANGALGGILLMLDRRVVEKVEECVGRSTVACSLRNSGDNVVWAFVGVYGPNDDRDRRDLWVELAGLMSLWELPWCIGGDFNVVRFPSERSSGASYSATMEEFSDFIFMHNLVDLPLVDGQFTWSNNQEDQIWSKINRFLVSSEWEERFPDVSQRRLPRLLSDHFSLFLDCGAPRGGNRYFKFENMWLNYEGFVEQVKMWWMSYEFSGLPSFILANKLKDLKIDLKKWNEEVFGGIGKKKKELLESIRELDLVEECRCLEEDKKVRKVDMLRELEETLLLEEMNWRQKSRALWLKEGDKNTNFFHRVANSHRKFSQVDSLSINGTISRNLVEIKEHIVQYYNNLYFENCSWRPRVEGLSFLSIDAEESIWLEREFEEKEV